MRATVGYGAVGAQFAVAKPLYSQVRDLIAAQIAGGEVGPGAALPNESVLAQRFGVSVGTIRRAVEGLEDMGVVTRRQGRGTFVAGASVSVAKRLQRICGPNGEKLRLTRKTLRSSRRQSRPDELAQFLMPAPAEVIEVTSSVAGGKGLVGVEHAVLHGAFVPELDIALRQGRDVYSALGAAGIIVTRAEDRIAATAAGEEVAELLSVAVGTPVLEIVRRVFTVTGQPAEVSVGTYLSNAVTYAAST